MRQSTFRSLVAALAALAAMAGCTISKATPPPLTGPSELGLSIQMTANPDVIRQDGASQSLIRIQARGPNGEPARSVSLRAEITVGGIIVDFGRLSARNLVTDNNGQATLIYTAPAFVGDPVDTGTVVTILITPAETDNRNAVPRQLDIRLVPPGVIEAPNSAPTAAFTFTPSNPQVLQTVVFDGSTSSDVPPGVVVSYNWDFGDGSSGSGQVAQHSYKSVGTYPVTLTVTDNGGKSSSPVSQAVTVGAGTSPTASFVFSPSSPVIHQDIVFNGAASTAAPGRTIVRYDWNFGSGNPQCCGVVAIKSYETPGTYQVTLTVTDDAGLTATAQLAVTVTVTGGQSPNAVFTVSPTSPRVGQQVNFNASGSTSPGFTITKYEWDFGDGTPPLQSAQPTATHTYTAAATFIVRLTITDSGGRTGTSTQNVSVALPPGPTAVFSVAKLGGNAVQADATSSTSPSGTPLSYRFSWGDGFADGPQASPIANHVYLAAGTYTITLTVTDGNGLTASSTQSVTVP